MNELRAHGIEVMKLHGIEDKSADATALLVFLCVARMAETARSSRTSRSRTVFKNFAQPAADGPPYRMSAVG